MPWGIFGIDSTCLSRCHGRGFSHLHDLRWEMVSFFPRMSVFAHLLSRRTWARADPGALSRPPRGDRRGAGGPSGECHVGPRTCGVRVAEGICTGGKSCRPPMQCPAVSTHGCISTWLTAGMMRATSRIRFVLRMLKLERPASSVRGGSLRSVPGPLANGTGLARVDELLHGLPRICVASRQIVIDERLYELVNKTLT